jgi:tetratricopeptide (TPR) repeat protein
MKRSLFGSIIIALLLAGGVLAQSADECNLEGETLDYERIIEACTLAIEDNPINADAWFSRAYAYTELGQLDDSIADYTQSLALDPDNQYAYGNRGYAYYLQSDFDSAIADYTRGLEIDDSLSWILANRAYAYYDNGDLDLARVDAETLIEQGAADGYMVMAGIVEAEGDYQAAIQNYSQAILIEPMYANAYVGRGFNLWQLGDFEDSAPDFYQWLVLSGQNVETLDAEVIEFPFTLEFDGANYYQLPLEGGVGVELNVTAVAEEVTIDPLLILLDSDDTPIYADDDTGGGEFGLDATITDFPLPSVEGYTLIIGYSGGGSSGRAEVTVEVEQQEVKT